MANDRAIKIQDFYFPTPAVIRTSTARIRSEWRTTDYRRRAQAARALQRRLLQMAL